MGDDVFARRVDLPQLGAQRLDVGVHGAVGAVAVVAPGGLQQLLARVDAAGAAQQRAQQAVFAPGQRQRHAVQQDALACKVHLEPTRCAVAQGRRHRAAPQQRLDARHQLARAERLAHIVVGAQFQAQHTVDLLVAGAQHQDGGRALRADLAAQVQPAAIGQAHVQHQQVKGAGLQGAAGVAQQQAMQHGEAIALQRVNDGPGNGRVVFQQQQACHGRPGVWSLSAPAPGTACAAPRPSPRRPARPGSGPSGGS